MDAIKADICSTLDIFLEEEGHELYHAQIDYTDKLDKIIVFVHSKTELFASIIQNIHKEIQILLQELGHEIGTYELVVSTTGIEMPLYTKRHFEIAIGKTIVLELSQPLDSSNLYKAIGLLSVVNEFGIEIDLDNKLIAIDYLNIKSARTMYEYKAKVVKG